MKKLKSQIFVALLLTVVIISCKKVTLERFTPDRMFTPTSISITTGDTSAVITWPASLFSAGSGVTYTLEISTDSLFKSAPVLTLKVDSTAAVVTDNVIKDRTPYFARVKANATANAAGSDQWVASTTTFSLVGVQIFHPVQSTDIIDNAVILNWTTSEGVDKIIFTKANGDTMQVAVTADANDAGQQLVEGLSAGTNYTAEIFAGNKSKGILTFTTKAPVTGNNIIDLRLINDRPSVLFDTLSQIPDGAIVLLKRGLTYTIPSAYTFDKAVSIRSGLGFGNPAELLLSNNFDASGNIDSLNFSDLTIATDGNANYFMNVGHATVIGNVKVENCTTNGVFNNSFIRLKTSGAEITNLLINNCIIDSFGIGAKYAVIYASGSNNAVIDNITIQNSTFYSIYYFVRQDGVTGKSLNINNCTFNNMINQGGYFINYSGTFPSNFNIMNTILGSTLDATNANGIKSSGNAVLSNTYMTSDCVFSANPITGATSYSGTAANLFNNPANGDFTIKDNSFAGKSTAGDPRWR
jgi:uncharacterized protein DUF5123